MRSRLVVFEMHHLGDAVMALPFLRAAAKTYETTVFCRQQTALLLAEAVPGIIVHRSETWRFVDLPQFETIARMHGDGPLEVPFRAVTMAPISTYAGSPEKLIARSRERFSSSRRSRRSKNSE